MGAVQGQDDSIREIKRMSGRVKREKVRAEGQVNGAPLVKLSTFLAQRDDSYLVKS